MTDKSYLLISYGFSEGNILASIIFESFSPSWRQFGCSVGIIALESQRNRCLVVGDDPGLLSEEHRQVLSSKQILSHLTCFHQKDEQGNWSVGSISELCGRADEQLVINRPSAAIQLPISNPGPCRRGPSRRL